VSPKISPTKNGGLCFDYVLRFIYIGNYLPPPPNKKMEHVTHHHHQPPGRILGRFSPENLGLAI